MDPPMGNEKPSGGVLIAQLGKNQYLVTGYHARVSFLPPKGHAGEHFLMDKVEQGYYENGQWHFVREWNGDQTDSGLNFTGQPQVLHVKLATY